MNALQGSTTQDAAQAMKYYPIWQAEYAEGKTQLQFHPWLQQYLGQQSENSLAGTPSP